MKRQVDDSFIAQLNKLLLPLWGLRAGLRTTMVEFFLKKATVQYPDQELVFAPIFRGRHSLLQEPGTKKDLCIMCKQCERICPNQCIEVVIKTDENKKRSLENYLLDLTKCLFCGLCQEVCPTDCIVLSGGDAAYSALSRDGLKFDRYAIEREASEEEWAAMQAKKEAEKAAKAAKAAQAAPKPEAKAEDKPKTIKTSEPSDIKTDVTIKTPEKKEGESDKENDKKAGEEGESKE
jgi:NADH-quinone oxidoreductase subunit I